MGIPEDEGRFPEVDWGITNQGANASFEALDRAVWAMAHESRTGKFECYARTAEFPEAFAITPGVALWMTAARFFMAFPEDPET